MDKADKLISIVIPCYNVEKYIDRCISTIIGQSMDIDNFEIICVNDASDDDTLILLENWEKRYPENILIVNLEQSYGAGTARNVGMDYACGKYISFIDGDDEVEYNFYELLYKGISKYKTQICECDYDRPGYCDAWYKIEENHLWDMTDTEVRMDYLEKYLIECGVWNRLYDREFLLDSGVRFPDGLFYEDLFFTPAINLVVPKIYKIKECLYHWHCNEGSVSNANTRNEDRLKIEIALLNWYRNNTPNRCFDELYEYKFFSFGMVINTYVLAKMGAVTYDYFNTMKELMDISVPEIQNNTYYCYKKLSSLSTKIEIIVKTYFETDYSVEDICLFTQRVNKYLSDKNVEECVNNMYLQKKSARDIWNYIDSFDTEKEGQ